MKMKAVPASSSVARMARPNDPISRVRTDVPRRPTKGRVISGRNRPVHQLVADAPDRLDLRLAAADLVAHPGHVNIDRARIAGAIVAPGQLEQSLALVDHPGVAGQRGQQVELLRPQLHPLAGDASLAVVEVDI